MKKLFTIMIALVLIVSGVAAVSAYEAHLINVKAHVENALEVDTTEIDFGTVFPEEWLSQHRTVQLSESAVTELASDLASVDIKLFAEWKPIPQTSPVAYYNWMGYFTYVGWNVNNAASEMELIGEPPAGAPGTAAVEIAGPYTLTTDDVNTLYVSIDVPVFEGYYNNLTDPEPKPSGFDDPTYIITKAAWGDKFDPDGMDFGLDLKVQVTNIVRGIVS